MLIPKLFCRGESGKQGVNGNIYGVRPISAHDDNYRAVGQHIPREGQRQVPLRLLSVALGMVLVFGYFISEDQSSKQSDSFEEVVSRDGFSGGESIYKVRGTAHFAMLSLGRCLFPEATAQGDFSKQEPQITSYTVEYGSQSTDEHGDNIPFIYTVQNAAGLRKYPELEHC